MFMQKEFLLRKFGLVRTLLTLITISGLALAGQQDANEPEDFLDMFIEELMNKYDVERPGRTSWLTFTYRSW